jgi:NADPH:quinone reductase-like Zn-dependent oxidoreductase
MYVSSRLVEGLIWSSRSEVQARSRRPLLRFATKATIDPGALFAKRASMCGIQVGSRDMFEAMVSAMDVARLEPVIDRVFEFSEALAAYEHLASGRHFGKVVIRVS